MNEDTVKRLPLPPFKTSKKNKAKYWLKRFLPAEISGTITALVASYVAHHSTNNLIIAAYAGSIGETVGFYAAICFHDVAAKQRILTASNRRLSVVDYLHILKNILVDFGIAELLDSFLLRPFFMYIFPQLIGNYPLGVVAGKLASDICFYLPVILLYEIRLFLGRRH